MMRVTHDVKDGERRVPEAPARYAQDGEGGTVSGSQPEVSAVTGARTHLRVGRCGSDRHSIGSIPDKTWRPGEIESI